MYARHTLYLKIMKFVLFRVKMQTAFRFLCRSHHQVCCVRLKNGYLNVFVTYVYINLVLNIFHKQFHYGFVGDEEVQFIGPEYEIKRFTLLELECLSLFRQLLQGVVWGCLRLNHQQFWRFQIGCDGSCFAGVQRSLIDGRTFS